MCVPACTQKIARDLNRRGFLKAAAGSVAGVVAATACTPVAPPPMRVGGLPAVASTGASAALAPAANGVISFSRIVDLTHTLTIDFPTYGGSKNFEIETLFKLADNGYNMKRWLLVEHTGTHMDAPFHFSDQDSADLIPVDKLYGPLAIVDIRAKAAENADAQLTLDDLKAWEATYGPLPAGAIVAMNSGWDQFVVGDKFGNADNDNVMHFPGFHVEAVEFLLEERDVKGIMVDTLSLDFGSSADFATHYRWLASNHWGIECVANLGELPALGATVIVGGPKVGGATGGLSRIFALV